MKSNRRTLLRIFAAAMAMATLLAACSDGEAEPISGGISTSTEETGDDISANRSGSGGESWAIYWYLCGSDLETRGGYATNDIIEMQKVDLPDNVTVVIQTGGANKWDNEVIDSSAMYRLEYTSAGTDIVETIPNASMGDSGTFIEFLDFCMTNYPADRVGLILWDHGGGSGSGICVDELYGGDYLSLPELDNALLSVCGEETPFEFIGFDACLMATIDVAALCSGYANYMIASEETEPGCGWKYDGFLSALAGNTGMDGAELGRAICDSYYEGCEEIGAASGITLSVVDLTKLGGLLDALDAFGREGLTTALEGDPSAFFADYGRGAVKAEYYSDGDCGMVDLVSLADANEHLFPENAEAIRKGVADCVTYQVTGPYRAGSNGISGYFPYSMNEDQYEVFSSGAASPAMTYLYELLLKGEFSEEAGAYLAQAEDFEDSLLDGDWEFADASALGLSDHPVDIVEDDGGTYAQLNIGPDAADLLQRVTFMLAYYLDDGETVIVLGEEFDIDCDWENGVFTDSFRGVWGSIDGHLVSMEVTSVTENYILYDVPILINGDYYILTVSYVYDTESYEILTARPENEDSEFAAKEQRLLMPGDEITTLLYYLEDSAGDEGYYEDETFTFSAESRFEEIELADGEYAMLFVMTDYRNEAYASASVGVNIEDGYIDIVSLD